MLLANLTWPDVQSLPFDRTIVVLPTGSIEQHGPHLPVSVDTDLVSAIASGVERKLPDNILLLPTLWPGLSTHHNAFPGTMDVAQSHYIQLITDLGLSIARMGAKKVFILNGHGGNDTPLRAALRELKTSVPDVRFVFASYWTLAAKAFKEIRTSEMGGMAHACEMETSMMLHLHPEKVRMHLAKRDGPKHQDVYRKADMQFARPVFFVNEFNEVSASGVVGHPDLATAEKGKRFYESAVASVVEFLEHFQTWEPERAS
jgi:creatinine amidohydrolase